MLNQVQRCCGVKSSMTSLSKLIGPSVSNLEIKNRSLTLKKKRFETIHQTCRTTCFISRSHKIKEILCTVQLVPIFADQPSCLQKYRSETHPLLHLWKNSTNKNLLLIYNFFFLKNTIVPVISLGTFCTFDYTVIASKYKRMLSILTSKE